MRTAYGFGPLDSLRSLGDRVLTMTERVNPRWLSERDTSTLAERAERDEAVAHAA